MPVTDGNAVKVFSEYEPKSKKFMEMCSMVMNNIPAEEIMEIRDEYVDELRNIDMSSSSMNDEM